MNEGPSNHGVHEKQRTLDYRGVSRTKPKSRARLWGVLAISLGFANFGLCGVVPALDGIAGEFLTAHATGAGVVLMIVLHLVPCASLTCGMLAVHHALKDRQYLGLVLALLGICMSLVFLLLISIPSYHSL
jgi:hypothetical protein